MKSPKVAIVHYHLKPGGVTRVIETASRCLTSARIPHVVLCGTDESAPPKVPLTVVPELNYDSRHGDSITAPRLVQRMRRAARKALGSRPDVWHLHNHSLGKNRALSDAAGILAEAREPLVLQYHDFAEDGRPDNYAALAQSETLYPHGRHVIHAFINSRDRRHLIATGLPEAEAVLHPNAITPPARVRPATIRPAAPLVLYPVRGIRRKNLGELFLLSLCSPPGTRYAVTLAPANPRWSPIHDEWAAFAKDTGLPVELDVADRIRPLPGTPKSFASWVRHSTHFITTSVAEGFGLGFLEPATLGKPLLGREIPMLADDFRAAGIRPGRFYRRLLIPESWVGLEILRQILVRHLRSTLERYGLPMSSAQLEKSFHAMRHHGHLDFANLPEGLQRQILHRIIASGETGEVLAASGDRTIPLRDWLIETLSQTEPTLLRSDLAAYSLPSYTRRLRDIYGRAVSAESEAPGYLPKNRVLDRFTQPGSFHFLRS